MTQRLLPFMGVAVALILTLFTSLVSAQRPIPMLPTTYKVATGQSFVSPDEAALELQNAINREVRTNQCKPLSIGAGTGSGTEGVAFTVHALLECPRLIIRQ